MHIALTGQLDSYWNTVWVLLPDALSFRLALFEGVLVLGEPSRTQSCAPDELRVMLMHLELGPHRE
jgi:hypothetical protein